MNKMLTETLSSHQRDVFIINDTASLNSILNSMMGKNSDQKMEIHEGYQEQC